MNCIAFSVLENIAKVQTENKAQNENKIKSNDVVTGPVAIFRNVLP